MASVIKIIIFFFFVLNLCACGQGIVENNKGTRAFKSEDYISARDHYIGALLKDPNSVYYRYNLAIANTVGEKLSDALKELEAVEISYQKRKVEKSEYANLYRLYFAKAFVHALTQNIDEALKYYQKALEINPDSIDVKKNIELLIQQKKSQSGKDGKPSKDKKDGGLKKAPSLTIREQIRIPRGKTKISRI